MNVNFYGMSVEVPNATSPKDAYERLRKALDAAGFREWDTDGYQVQTNDEGEYVDKGTTVPLIRG